MSFVVMGMEAPENCLKCLMNCRTPDGKIMCRRDFRERNPLVRDRCSIFPLPKEHGRIVDVGPLEVVAYSLSDHEGESFDDGVEFILEKLDALPTIVEAKGE